MESFHDRLANFANSGMRDDLADNLHLAGTARHNLSIRHKRLFLTRFTNEDRKQMPAAWEKVVPYWNHLELWHVNLMATDVGIAMPFPMAEKLPPDNGERFFSEYMKLVKPMQQKYHFDQCLCNLCGNIDMQQQQQQLPVPPPKAAPPTVARSTEQQIIQRISNPVVNPIPRPLPPSFHQFIPSPWMQFQPMPMPIYYVPQQPTVCCSRCMRWRSNNHRKGRPPHDSCCYQRNNGGQWARSPENGSEIMRNMGINFSL